ncbi:MAG: hypothetical protein GY847_39675 [Proteobacteria bacterium]|nr:hypothetical protein [Pseudomonadota bacterium]
MNIKRLYKALRERSTYIAEWLFHHSNERNKVVYYAHYPAFYIMMFKPIHRFIPSVPIVASHREGVKEQLVELNIKTEQRGFPTIVVTSDFPDKMFPCPFIRFINTSHGVADKKYTYDPIKNMKFSLQLSPGTFARDRLVCNGYPDHRIAVVGMPKLDALFDGSLSTERIIGKLPIDPSKKTILYAPTCRDDFNSLPIFAEYFSKIDRKYNIIVKLHPGYNPILRNDGIRWIELFNKMDNVYLAPFEDPIEFMYISDLLIADAGSMMFEFAAMNKPVLLLNRGNINRVDGFDQDAIEQKWRDIGLQIDSPEQLNESIEYCFQKPEDHEEKRLYYSKKLFYKFDGKSSLRAAREIRKYAMKLGINEI